MEDNTIAVGSRSNLLTKENGQERLATSRPLPLENHLTLKEESPTPTLKSVNGNFMEETIRHG